jgi:hypothetical protein
LKNAFGTSAGTQDFKSVEYADVILVIGANPTDAHPVFASRMKKLLREGARLIVVDPRRIDLVRSPHIEASHFLQLRPGTCAEALLGKPQSLPGLFDVFLLALDCLPVLLQLGKRLLHLQFDPLQRFLVSHNGGVNSRLDLGHLTIGLKSIENVPGTADSHEIARDRFVKPEAAD